MVGENLRDGDMEVAFELWIERISISVDSNGIPPLSREAISEHSSRIVNERKEIIAFLSIERFFRTRMNSLNLGGTTDTSVRPKHYA